jgi:hypothetical protein
LPGAEFAQTYSNAGEQVVAVGDVSADDRLGTSQDMCCAGFVRHSPVGGQRVEQRDWGASIVVTMDGHRRGKCFFDEVLNDLRSTTSELASALLLPRREQRLGGFDHRIREGPDLEGAGMPNVLSSATQNSPLNALLVTTHSMMPVVGATASLSEMDVPRLREPT